MQFNKNDSITLDDEKLTIVEPLGEGGQGEVYLVEYQGNRYALKVYKDEFRPILGTTSKTISTKEAHRIVFCGQSYSSTSTTTA